MTQGNALIKNTLIIAVGKLFTQSLTFLLLPIYTTFLSPKVFGELDLIILYVGLLAPTLTLQMEMSVFRHLIDVRASSSNAKVRRIISSALAIIVTGVIFGATAIAMVGSMLELRLTPFIVGAFASTVFLNFFLQVARGKGRNDIFAVASIVTGIVNMALSVFLLTVLHASAEGILLALIIANIVGVILLILKTRALHDASLGSINKDTVKQLVGYSWPLVPNHVALWGIGGISRTVVATTLGLAATGVFASANKFSLIYASLYSVFALSWTESVSLHIGKRGSFLSNATNSTIRLFGSLSLLTISVTSVAFPFLVSSEFSEAKLYIPLLVVGSFFASIVTHYGAIYLAVKETRKIAIVTFQALVISTVLTLAGIWYIGLYAPALATVATYGFIAVRRHYDIQRFTPIRYSEATILPLLLIAIVVIICYYVDNSLLDIVSLIFTICTIALLNLSDVHRITSLISKKGKA